MRSVVNVNSGASPSAKATVPATKTARPVSAPTRANTPKPGAASTLDYERDEADGGRRITGPVLARWSARGFLQSCGDVLAVWRERADDVRGGALHRGHFLTVAAPDETYSHLHVIFAA